MNNCSTVHTCLHRMLGLFFGLCKTFWPPLKNQLLINTANTVIHIDHFQNEKNEKAEEHFLFYFIFVLVFVIRFENTFLTCILNQQKILIMGTLLYFFLSNKILILVSFFSRVPCPYTNKIFFFFPPVDNMFILWDRKNLRNTYYSYVLFINMYNV